MPRFPRASSGSITSFGRFRTRTSPRRVRIPEAADARFPTRVPSPTAAAAAREKERVDAAIVRAASTPVVSDADRTERASRKPIRGRWGAAPG